MNEQNDPILIQVPEIKPDLNYEIREGKVFIITEHNTKIQNFVRKLGKKIPEQSELELDEYSSFVFRTIDGNNSIYQIGQKLIEQYGEDVNPVYERLVVFIYFLRDQKKYITLK